MNTTIIIEQLIKILGRDGWMEDPLDIKPYVTDWRGYWQGSCLGVASPTTTDQVSKILSVCNETGTPVTPIGGNTGLVGGGVPNGGIVLSTRRLNRVLGMDIANQTISVEAGCILADIQATAIEKELLFPLSLGAEGTCQIGGNLSTNAGGVGVLRYGNARDLTLGLEVVLPSGEILNGMTGLRKNNTGYDLKHLFMGAEGTLGVITGAVLKLFPAPKSQETAMFALPSMDIALDFLLSIRANAGDNLTAFEIINSIAMELVIKNIPDTKRPFSAPHPFYALVELSSVRATDDLRGILESYFSKQLNLNPSIDAVLAENTQQARALWQLRESIPEAQVIEGASIKHDVSVPISSVPEFVHRAGVLVKSVLPHTRVVAFGHMGDGNIHYNLTVPLGSHENEFLDKWANNRRKIYDLIDELGGSFSAEHGIGKLKVKDLEYYGHPTLISSMRAIKCAIDPNSIMNPNKVIS